jgi:Tol biopolymer transport system component
MEAKMNNNKFMKILLSLLSMASLSLPMYSQEVGITQLTDTRDDFYEKMNQMSFTPMSMDASGNRVAFYSKFDLAPGRPGNSDGNSEIFLWTRGVSGFTQITDSIGGDESTRFANLNPSTSANGRRIVFMSNRDLTPGRPGNADGNYEIFLWTEGSGIRQITNTIGGDEFDGFAHGWPVISGDGRTLAFHSTRPDVPGTNPDGHIEVVVWKEGHGFIPITDTTVDSPPCPRPGCSPEDGLCGVSFAISLNHDGSRLALYSDRDLAPGRPGNPDGNTEIFLWQEGRGITQITNSTGGCYWANRNPSISADGTRIAFTSNRNYAERNEDSNQEIFLWKQGTGITQITDTRSYALAPDNTSAALSRDGKRIVFWSSRNLTPAVLGNTFGNYSLFLWTEGRGFRQLTKALGGSPSDPIPGINADGTWIAFNSDRDLRPDSPGNPDRNVEIFLANVP